MSGFSVATWNINSVRLRIAQVTRFLAEAAPDVLCLQETKCSNDAFPAKALADAGYPHHALNGKGGQHGVAIVSKHTLTARPAPDHCMNQHPRVVVAQAQGVEIHNYYVPAGGDEPDPALNEKFAHKLNFIERMRAYFEQNCDRFAQQPALITGDLNIAPSAFDVWSHKQLLNVVSHTPVETEGLLRAQEAGGFVDVVRAAIPEPQKVYSWWSYRARDWRKSNRGRRLDHIWASPPLAAHFHVDDGALQVRDHTRDWDKPSDHIPVVARFRL